MLITMKFTDEDRREKRSFDLGDEGGRVECCLFHDDEPIEAEITLRLPASQSLEHTGITCELIGVVEKYYDRAQSQEFTRGVLQLASGGRLRGGEDHTFKASFGEEVSRPHESYNGINVRCRYYLRVRTESTGFSATTHEKCLHFVQSRHGRPGKEAPSKIRMEVGIEEYLHIEFEYDKHRYHLQDVVMGNLYFLLVRLRLKYAEVAIIRREQCEVDRTVYNESETIAKYEVMDGSPVKNEQIPIRLYLDAYNLTPTIDDQTHRFSVKYFLNLVLVDEGDRRYFKQHEVELWRKKPLDPDFEGQEDRVLALEDGSASDSHPSAAGGGGGGGSDAAVMEPREGAAAAVTGLRSQLFRPHAPVLPTLAQASAADAKAEAEAEAKRKEAEDEGNALRSAPAGEGSAGGEEEAKRKQSGIFEQAASPKPSVKLPKGLLLGAASASKGSDDSALF